jgi:hypothetical protein
VHSTAFSGSALSNGASLGLRRKRISEGPNAINAHSQVSIAAGKGTLHIVSEDEVVAFRMLVPECNKICGIAVGLFIRLRILESPAFSRVKELGAESKLPLGEVLRDYRIAAILAIGLVLIISSGYFIVTTFALSYITGQLGLARNVPLIRLLLAGAAQMAGILIFAWVADRGKRPVAIWSATCLFLLSYPFFWLVDHSAATALRESSQRGSSRHDCVTRGFPSATRWPGCSEAASRRSSPLRLSSGRAAPRGPSPVSGRHRSHGVRQGRAHNVNSLISARLDSGD